MDFNYLGFVREILAMNKQSDVTALSTDHEEDAYKVQWCVNDTIADLNNILRLKARQSTFEFDTVVGQRTYVLTKKIQWPLLGLRQKVTDIPLTQMSAKEFDMLVPDDDSSGEPGFYY